jgi:hypothetical protein
MKVERVFFHTESYWNDLVGPIGTPEFALLDSNQVILYRWIGVTERQEFTSLLDPLCRG